MNKPAAFRLPGDVDRYNDVARDVMQKHGIQVNDLNRQLLKQGAPKWTSDGVRFSSDGYLELARFAALAIEAAIPKSRK